MMTAYREYRIVLERTGAPTADLMVVSIDGNCATFSEARRPVRAKTLDRYEHILVVACPDPHISALSSLRTLARIRRSLRHGLPPPPPLPDDPAVLTRDLQGSDHRVDRVLRYE